MCSGVFAHKTGGLGEEDFCGGRILPKEAEEGREFGRERQKQEQKAKTGNIERV